MPAPPKTTPEAGRDAEPDVYVALSPSERAGLDRDAAAVGLPAPDYARHLVLGRYPDPAPWRRVLYLVRGMARFAREQGVSDVVDGVLDDLEAGLIEITDAVFPAPPDPPGGAGG